MLLSSGGLIPGRAWAQSGPIPLGGAAQFGLLAHDALLASDSVLVIGAAGAVSVAPTIRATAGVFYRPTSAAVTTALADLAQAKATCAARVPATSINDTLSGQVLAPGTYTIAGNALLRRGTPLRLSGDSSSVYVFNISGELRALSQATVNPGDVLPANIYWNVTGIVRLADFSGLHGIVLGGDSIIKTGIKGGPLALLTTGTAVRADGMHPSIGDNQFQSPATLATWVSGPRPCLPAPAFTGNLIPNPSFEQSVQCPSYFSNMQPLRSDVCSWSSSSLVLCND